MMKKARRDEKTYAIIGAAMEVHKRLGHGFLEAVYQEALALELTRCQISFNREVQLPIFYRNQLLKTSYRADFVCFENIIVELKAISRLSGNEEAQIINYLKATNFPKGLLINFGNKSLEYKRFINTPTK